MKKSNLTLIALVFALLVWSGNAMAQMTANEAVKAMGRGINLGNTLEPEQEAGWNNGPAQEYYFDMYKEAGFATVRIPVRWDKHTATTAPFEVDDDFMDRVEQIVDWGLDRDLFIVLNMHHEESFQNDYAGQKERYESIWSQISARFKDKSEKLIFEMMNEPHAIISQNEIDEFNVNVLGIIRETNATRNVIYSGKGWASANDMMEASIPDKNDAYLMAYYHSYDPWDFAGEGNGKWGTSSDIQQMIDRMSGVQDWSESNNIPVFIGEFGAQRLCEYNSRMFYYATYVEQALAHNQCFAEWDDGGDFQTMLRDGKKWNDIKDILIYTSDTSPTTLKVKMVEDTVVQLTWESRLATKERVLVERRTLNTEFSVIAEFGAVSSTTTVIEYNDADILNNNTYYYRVIEEVKGLASPSYPISIPVVFSTSIGDSKTEAFKVYPNPASTSIDVVLTGEVMQNVKIYNSNGQVIVSDVVENNMATFNIEAFKSGMYFIVANTDNGLIKRTFVKQ
ncbi:MAG: cellulase family glycosylhydrolase [Salinivirgaceae bacterium]|jgi:aryl-phospho-beta-D-glucosidase BglC (GH1 family)|nr:cellulase family glycosylhydrolase [Salinivirgaceae bacterium]